MRVWQQQPYDRVLRRNERRRLPLCESIRYIWNNPVRAGITANVLDYPYLGSFLETNARLDSEEWWDDLWEVALSER